MANPITYERLITDGSEAGNTEHGIRISNGCFAREFGTSEWTHIRMGIRYRLFDVNDTGITRLDGTPRLCFGFCNGTDNIPGDSSWNNWVAVVNETAIWSTWTATYIGPGGTQYLYTGSCSPYRLFNDEGKTTNYYGTNNYIQTLTSSVSMFFLDLVKSGTTDVFGSNAYYRTSTATDYVSEADFLTDLQSTSPSRTGYVFKDWNSSITYHFTSSHSTRPLNSVFAYWDRTDPALEITDLYVVRLA